MDQDTSSNVYDFPAREYGIQGSWPSPDPAGLAAANQAKPQLWNRYAYALNNPLAMTDPTGLCPSQIIADDCGCDDGWGWGGIFAWGWNWAYGVDPYGSVDAGPQRPPQAPPAPSGGYGAGIDPFGTSFMPGEIAGVPVWLWQECWLNILDCSRSSFTDATLGFKF